MKESELTVRFAKDLKKYRQANKLSSHFWYKLADVPLNSMVVTLRQCLCKSCLARVSARTGLFRYQGGKNPFDVLCVVDGIPIALEFKLHRDHTAFPLDQVKDHQNDALREFHNAYGLAFVMIGVTHEDDKAKWVVPGEWFYRGRLEYVAMVSIKQWYWLNREMQRLGRKSFPLEYLWKQEVPLCGRVTGVGNTRSYDIETFLSAIKRFSEEEFEEIQW